MKREGSEKKRIELELWKQEHQERLKQEQLEEELENERLKKECNLPVVKIFSTNYVVNLANGLRKVIRSLDMGIECAVHIRQMAHADITNRPNEIYFILNFQDQNLLSRDVASCLPSNRYVLYQLEQLNSPIKFKFRRTREMSKLVESSLATFEYSQANIPYYAPKGSSAAKKVVYLPLLLGSQSATERKKKYDVLFYGTLNARRRLILRRLAEELNIKVVSDVFGRKLTELVGKSKIILNIHHYRTPLMETARLHEALGQDVVIVSEGVSEQERSLMDVYDGLVRFVDPVRYSMDNIESLSKAIKSALEEWETDHSDPKRTKQKWRKTRVMDLYNEIYEANRLALRDVFFF